MDDSLSFESLFEGAKKFAGLALQAHRDGDDEVFVLHAGLSMERLMKATLAKANPVLLMETGSLKDDRALLHFAGLRLHGERVRTVSASGALGRIRAAGWLPKDPELDDLIELRNGVVHLGPTESESADVLATMGRTTNALLTHLGEALSEYWGDWQSVIEISLNDQLEKIVRDVKRLIEQARHRYAERIRGLPDDAVDLFKEDARIKGFFGFPSEGDEPIAFGRITCPACDNPHAVVLLMTGGLEDTAHRDQRRTAYVGYLCSLCSLPLTTIEQFDASGLDIMDVRVPVAKLQMAEEIMKNTLLAFVDALGRMKDVLPPSE